MWFHFQAYSNPLEFSLICYGSHGTYVILLNTSLNNRKQYVEFEEIKSEIRQITVGVHLLFIIIPSTISLLS